MEIHSLCIIKNSGVPIYCKNFSKEFQEVDFTLLSSFFGAILQFSSNVVNQRLNILDMGNLRFFFRNQDRIIFILIADNISSSLLINDRLDRICTEFYAIFDVDKCEEVNCMMENEQFEKKLIEIIHYRDDYAEHQMEDIKKVFLKEQSAGEIEAGALLSLKGEIFFSSLPIDTLHSALKEIEIRTKSNVQEIQTNPKFIMQTEKRTIFSQAIKLSQFQTPVYVILLFDQGTNLGMADYALEDIAKKLSSSV